ncbi:hypothetical protein FNF28_04984 [Cafeteria roenbergensis]|uniref:60S ribosomal protein L41 n=1 Tax=Cafeteria roenbergensis TaxID=33653 RepID=A0A5A8D8V8_CAFRO|nr:hypothetical protein FNF28_04984 [Cafeteria roenbergensis]
MEPDRDAEAAAVAAQLAALENAETERAGMRIMVYLKAACKCCVIISLFAAYVGLAMQTTSKCTDARVASTFPLFALVLALLGLCWPACFAFAMAVPTCIAESPKSVRRLQEIFLALSYLPMFAWAVYGVAVVVPYWDGKYSAMDSCSQPVRTLTEVVMWGSIVAIPAFVLEQLLSMDEDLRTLETFSAAPRPLGTRFSMRDKWRKKRQRRLKRKRRKMRQRAK